MNTTELKSKILKEIETERQNAINISELNKYKALKNAQYTALLNKQGALIIDIAKSKCKGTDTTLLEKELSDTHHLIDNTLNQIGLSLDDLTPQYKCRQCNDKGILDNGNYCQCFNVRLASEFNKLNSDLHKVSFDDCDRMNTTLIKKISELCEQFPSQKSNKVIFCGASGVGKTHLSYAIGNYFIKKNIFTIFISSANLNQLFLKYHTAPVTEKKDILDNIVNCEILIIDDLGTEPKLRNVTNEYLLYLINLRNTNNKLTVITTNLTPEGILTTYDERIFSRLFDKSNSLPILIDGEDKRIQ